MAPADHEGRLSHPRAPADVLAQHDHQGGPSFHLRGVSDAHPFGSDVSWRQALDAAIDAFMKPNDRLRTSGDPIPVTEDSPTAVVIGAGLGGATPGLLGGCIRTLRHVAAALAARVALRRLGHA